MDIMPQKPGCHCVSFLPSAKGRRQCVRTIEFGDEVCEVQGADEGEVAGFLGEQTDLLVLYCWCRVSSCCCISRDAHSALPCFSPVLYVPSPFTSGVWSLGCGSPPFLRCDMTVS